MKAFPLSALSAVALIRHGQPGHAQSPQHHGRLTCPTSPFRTLRPGSSVRTPAVRPRTGHYEGILQTEGGNPCVYSSGYRLGLERGSL